MRQRHGRTYYFMIALQVIIVLVVISLFLSLYTFTENLLITRCDEKATRDLERISLTIERDLSRAETAAFTFESMIFDGGRKLPADPEEIYVQMEHFLATMPLCISGVVVGFEDGIYPEQEASWGYVPLVRRYTDGSLARYNVGEARDVRAVNDWYSVTKQTDTLRWSKPFFSEEGEVICEFCIPLHDNNDCFIGVMGIDFSLANMSDEVCAVRSYPNATPSVIDEDFRILASVDKEDIMHETMFTYLLKHDLNFESDVYNEITHRKLGKSHIRQGSYQTPHETYFYFLAMEHVPWVVQMVCPADEVRNELYALRIRMSIISFATLLLVVVVALSFMRFK